MISVESSWVASTESSPMTVHKIFIRLSQDLNKLYRGHAESH